MASRRRKVLHRAIYAACPEAGRACTAGRALIGGVFDVGQDGLPEVRITRPDVLAKMLELHVDANCVAAPQITIEELRTRTSVALPRSKEKS